MPNSIELAIVLVSVLKICIFKTLGKFKLSIAEKAIIRNKNISNRFKTMGENDLSSIFFPNRFKNL
jgi:hypothetical protein